MLPIICQNFRLIALKLRPNRSKMWKKRERFLGAINIFKAIFGLFRFILKQICLFRMFQNTFETPKQTETKFSLVSKMNRNKRETDPVLVIFGSNRKFFLFVSWTP